MSCFSYPKHITDPSLLREFYCIRTKEDLAILLEVDIHKLKYFLHGGNRRVTHYTKFEISKKSGQKRMLCAPADGLKLLQRRLNYILQLVYRPNASAHGFVFGRGIISNATPHLKKRTIINLDLKDFFPSINFGRVRGLFMHSPFNFNEDVATALAQLCCYEGSLPQGAPTSPVISNMLCVRLDKDLRALARDTHCYYTRYADDITFSTDRSSVSQDIASLSLTSDNKLDVNLGRKVVDVIKANGFNINIQKIHAAKGSMHKQVTGVVVNEKLNVSRQYIRKIRSMLHAWQRYGLDQARAEHLQKYYSKNRLYSGAADYKAIVKGKIDYLGQVRGKNDYIYCKLYNWFNEIDQNGRPILPESFEQRVTNSVFVVKCGSKQGSGFLLRGVGLVTCNHVVDASPDIEVYKFNCRLAEGHLKASIKKQDVTKDLAILEVEFPKSYSYTSFDISKSYIGINTALTCIGFSDHKPGESFQKNSGEIQSIRYDKRGNQFYTYSNGLYSGQSGGPALDRENNVAGVITTGSANPGVPPRAAEMGIVPLDLLKEFISV